MSSYNMFLPSYSIGEDCYKEIPFVTRKYGKKAVVIGGKTAMSKAKEALLEGVKDSDVEILDFIWYGGNASFENVEMLEGNPLVQEADMLFGVGGGRAIDTVKMLGSKIDKPFFTFPTLGSNCAACTAISVVYNADDTFRCYDCHKQPAYHTFINTKIVAESPANLFWAGIGDAISKECEVVYTCQDKPMFHTPLLGKAVASICTDPLLEYGAKALEDCKKGIPSFELEQVTLSIIMSTGIVSNLVTHLFQDDPKDDFYYNSSLAHCFYNGSSVVPACLNHLHGEIVALGVLVLLTYAGQIEERDKIMAFNKSIGLPITLEDIEMKLEDIDAVVAKAPGMVEWKYIPGTPSIEKFKQAIIDADLAGRKAK